MSVTGIGYGVHNKARVALERALRNLRKRVLGVEWELILTFGFSTQGMGVGIIAERNGGQIFDRAALERSMTLDERGLRLGPRQPP